MMVLVMMVRAMWMVMSMVILMLQVPERRGTIKDMWWSRLQGCQKVVEDWQRILQVGLGTFRASLESP